MLTRCPHCHTLQRLSATMLMRSRGHCYCKQCYTAFDGLDRLYDWRIQALNSRQWQLTALNTLAGLLLITQLVQGYLPVLSQQAQTRPLVEWLAQYIHYPLPSYHNIDEISILQQSVTQQSQNAYHLELALLNQSHWSQQFPAVQLGIIDSEGHLSAQRIFYYHDFQGIDAHLNPGQIVNLQADIVPLDTPMAGYFIHVL